MSILKIAQYCMAVSGLLVLASLVLLIVPGPKLAIDFTGGTLMEISVPDGKKKSDVERALSTLQWDYAPLGNVAVSITTNDIAILRMRNLSNEEHRALSLFLQNQLGKEAEEHRFTTIGPTVGATLKQRALWALGIAAIAIILYLAYAFRHVPKGLNTWKFGVVAVVTLFHDILIVLGVFTVLSRITTFEVDMLFVVAMLTIVGYSVNDTIIIFDRIRANLHTKEKKTTFAGVAECGLRESLTRSFHTSISTLIVLVALFFLGSESIRWFVLTLIIGITIGTYSSICVATPLLVHWQKKQ